MKKLPIGIQSIEKILANMDYIYVDKTEFAESLIGGDAPHYFISRPRRFGKSLFLNTLKEIFKANKNLFKDCHIYNSDYEWQKFPVVLFDFSQIANRNPIEFEGSLKRTLQEIAKTYGLIITAPTVQEGLKALVVSLSSKQKSRVVVLIDEYDKPIIDSLSDLNVAKGNRDLLKGFFGTLKSLDKYLRFTFTTGVSKFSQVSLFSGPNNLEDITIDPTYAAMMGYTEKEVKQYFAEHIQSIKQDRSESGKPITEDAIVDEIQKWYNGYRFSKEKICVYNPFSTLKFMKAKEATSYWYSTGTPSFLINQVKKHPESTIPLAGITARAAELMDISSLDEIDLKALMFQTGYLTFQGYDSNAKHYQLGFPNQEVREAFIDSLVKHFAPINFEISSKCKEAMKQQNPSLFFAHLKVILASFPYQLFIDAKECTYHGILLEIMKGMGLAVEAERSTNIGRIDIVMEMPKTTYIIEIKLDGNLDAGLKQIYQKKYFEPYCRKGKEIALISLNFSSKTRNILDWKGQLLSESGKLAKELLPIQN